jgi:hypothetical protein
MRRWAAFGASAVVLVLTVSACGDADGPETGVAQGGPCEVDDAATGPMTTDAGGLLTPPVPQPSDWVDPPQTGFDWDGDGAGDTLGFDQDAGSVSVTWADGSLTVTGVRSDFAGEAGQPLDENGDPFLEQPNESGPPSESAEDAGLAAPVPAAVADVTGDDLLDLLVVDHGTVSVVVGQGSDSTTVEVAQEDIGSEVTGWRNPPVVPESPAGFSDDQPAVPYDQATILPRWDLTDDGVADWVVQSDLPRALGPQAAYAGKPCA